MKKKLLLHYRADCNTNDVWKAAISNGWSTDRIHDHNIAQAVEYCTRVRYYGNTIHGMRIASDLPFIFLPIDLIVLTKTKLTKRTVVMCRFDEMGTNAGSRGSTTLFLKPAKEKWFGARVYLPHESIPVDGSSLPSDPIYIQDPVDMINEVRCFCIDGKIATASYYRIGHQYCPIGIDAVDRPAVLDKMVEELAPMYPRGVVLDFAYTDRREWCFIEPNEAWASGIYGCDPVKCLDVIEASQADK